MVTMSGGHPIKVAATPPIEPAGSPTPPPTLTVPANLTIGMLTGPAKDDRWTAPVAGVYSMATWPPTLLEEKTMTDPIDTAEHFTQEAIDHSVGVAKRAKERMHAEQVESVRNRFRYHPPTHPDVIAAHEQARTLGELFAMFLLKLPYCDERDKALDAVDLATMHANSAIARTQLGITPAVDTPEQ